MMANTKRRYPYGLERTREVFQRLYPELTDDEIRVELENQEDLEEQEPVITKAEAIPIVQAFYKKNGYLSVAGDLGVEPQTVYYAVVNSIKALPQDSNLRIALQMGCSNIGILES